LNWPWPTNVFELLGFLGLIGYFHKFVRNDSLITRPLTKLLKKSNFGWLDAAKNAFQELKKAMTTTPTLAMLHFNDPFIIESDAFDNDIGEVLSQKGKPIAFMSRALGTTKQS